MFFVATDRLQLAVGPADKKHMNTLVPPHSVLDLAEFLFFSEIGTADEQVFQFHTREKKHISIAGGQLGWTNG